MKGLYLAIRPIISNMQVALLSTQGGSTRVSWLKTTANKSEESRAGVWPAGQCCNSQRVSQHSLIERVVWRLKINW